MSATAPTTSTIVIAAPPTRSKSASGWWWVLVLLVLAGIGVGVTLYLIDRNKKVDPCKGIDCGSFGKCVAGVCECTVGHFGTRCESVTPPSTSCQGVSCGSGRCSEGKCVCDVGWSGTTCAIQAPGPCADKTCGAPNGSCRVSGDVAVCQCINGYSGTDCTERPSGACANVQCGSYGNCEAGKCKCIEGYTGTKCDIPPSSANKGYFITTSKGEGKTDYLGPNEFMQSPDKKFFWIVSNRGQLIRYSGSTPQDATAKQDAVVSKNGEQTRGSYFLQIQGDGNWCIYAGKNPSERTGSTAVWCFSRHKVGNPNYVLVFLNGGNICAYPGQSWPSAIGPEGCCANETSGFNSWCRDLPAF